MENIEQAILQAIQEFGGCGYLINSGECEDFTTRVIDIMGGYTEELTDNATPLGGEYPGHYWIEYKGKCYDAECFTGVSNWRNLPIFKKVRS